MVPSHPGLVEAGQARGGEARGERTPDDHVLPPPRGPAAGGRRRPTPRSRPPQGSPGSCASLPVE